MADDSVDQPRTPRAPRRSPSTTTHLSAPTSKSRAKSSRVNFERLPSKPAESRRYADILTQYSQCTAANSLFPGPHFKPLANYLQQPFEAQASTSSTGAPSDGVEPAPDFVTLYNLNPENRSIEHFSRVADFEKHAASLHETSEYGQLLFMRGSPSPEWLLAIGTTYFVDPAFFYHHLDMNRGRNDLFGFPSLPSTLSTITRLRVTTIGDSGIDTNFSLHTQQELEARRESYAKLLGTYAGRFQEDYGHHKLGQSIIRNCSLYDDRHFALEQDISLWASKTEKSWIAIVWLDVGETGGNEYLLQPPHLPECMTKRWLTHYLPTIQHKRYAAFNWRRYKTETAPPHSSVGGIRPSQSSSILHLDYGHDLDRQIISLDSFYLFNEIFRFAAFSESQYLNMMHAKIAEELDHTPLSASKNLTLANLVYFEQSLERHISRLEENLKSIQSHATAPWPQQEKSLGQQECAASAADALLDDYRDLLCRAKELHARCDRGMQMTMSNASIQESRKAIDQAGEVNKLTRLAFLFVPLNFLTSFFGMNFEQLGTGILPIWLFFVVSIPLVLLIFLTLTRKTRDQSMARRAYSALSIDTSRSKMTGRSIDIERK